MNHLKTTPTSAFIFYRSYSRFVEGKRETWQQMALRCVLGLGNLGKFTEDEVKLIYSQIDNCTALPSGRYMWCGGTQWSDKPENYSGSYNCTSTVIDSIETFGHLMNLSMQGAGCGAVLELDNIAKLPPIRTKLNISVIGNPGDTPIDERSDETFSLLTGANTIDVIVGDSRRGWVESYLGLIQLACSDVPEGEINLNIDLSDVRPKGEPLSGFGGVANPLLLRDLYGKVANILNGAVGRQLTSIECCLLICEAAMVVVVGNIRRSALIFQFSQEDELARNIKNGLWKQHEDGSWYMPDPKLDSLRMGNHTTVFHSKPTLEQCIKSVSDQYYSGEGAIQWAGEAVARANADLLDTPDKKAVFLGLYGGDRELARDWLDKLGQIKGDEEFDSVLQHRMARYGLNPCFAAGTMVLTRNGHFPIESLVGKVVDVWDGIEWVEISNFRITGENQPVFSVNLQNGQSIVATDYHSFVLESGDRKLLKDLLPGDRLLTHDVTFDSGVDADGAYLKGFLIGDGTIAQGHAKLSLYPPKYMCEDRLMSSAYELKELAVVSNSCSQRKVLGWGFSDESYGRKNMQGLAQVNLLYWGKNAKSEFPSEVLNWSDKSKAEFISGVMDADGCAIDTVNGFGYQLTSIHKEWLIGFQLLLKTIGIDSKINPSRKGGMQDFGKGGIYETKDTHRLTISQIPSVKLSTLCSFSRLKSFASKTTKYQLKSRWNKIESIEFSHIADKVYCCTVPTNHQFSLTNGITIGQCGEIQMCNNYCNLSHVHLNRLDPFDLNSQVDAFKAATINVAALLHHEFETPRYQKSRELDPIVGVSFTGLFDFFVHLFGVEWLQWWQAGRPKHWRNRVIDLRLDNCRYKNLKPLFDADFIRQYRYDSAADLFLSIEEEYLCSWRHIVADTLTEYCERHQLKTPNRYTTVQPSGSCSLLSNASPGWHPPKAARFIRRMTFGRDEPIALAAIGLGYNVIPSQSDKDEHGNLLNDINDPRVTEWLVEIPCAASWADLPGVDAIDISQFSALAQFDFYMQVQRYYSTHTTSATIELREHEIEALATAIYEDIQNDGGYMSAALLARFDDHQTMPRMPFEPIDKDRYQQELANIAMRRTISDFDVALALHDRGQTAESGPSGCDSDKCMLPNR